MSLFEEPPSSCISEACCDKGDNDSDDGDAPQLADEDGAAMPSSQEPIAYSLVKRDGVYYIQSPEKVQEFMNIERYSERWPLIPSAHLHASSVQHPQHPEWRWLLHTRRVPVLQDADASQLGVPVTGGPDPPAEHLPPSAGIGDPTAIVWACWPCLIDLCSKRPLIPLNALVNDNWIGREWFAIREATVACKTLLSLGRACWKQVRLGRGKPDVQQTAVCGNTIFFAQPTADIPSMELPPPTGAFVDSLNIILTRKTDDLRYATWATVNREQYLTIARQRKQDCPVFANAMVKEEEAQTRLPADGVPEHMQKCTQHVDGAAKAPVRMSGPASRAPELGRSDEAGEASDRSDASEDEDAVPDVDLVHDNVAEYTIALDPVHDVAPVRMLQALKGTIEAVTAHAAQIAKNEKTAQVADNDGALQPVVDEGGRHSIKSLV